MTRHFTTISSLFIFTLYFGFLSSSFIPSNPCASTIKVRKQHFLIDENARFIGLNDSLLIENLKQANLKKYIGLPIDSFLKAPALSNYVTSRFIDEPTGYLNYLYLKYSDKVGIKIYARDLRHVQKYDIKSQWNLSDFSKEFLSEIVLINDRNIIEVIK